MSQLKKLATRRHQITNRALRESLRAHGQLLPVLILGGVVVDGRRRQRLLREMGRTPVERVLKTHHEAAQVLWVLHPYQAWEEYRPPLLTTREEAEYFGCSVADVSMVKKVLNPKTRTGELRNWSAGYKIRWNKAQLYLSRVRQGQVKLTLNGIENALALPPFKKAN